VVIRTLRSALGRHPLEIPGLEEDPFIDSDVENLKLLAAGKATALYGFSMGGNRYALKILSGIHHRNTLTSIYAKKNELETLGFPKVHSINHDHSFYIMEYLRGESVFDRVVRAGRRRLVRRQMDLAVIALLSTVAALHSKGWLLNDLSWRNFMFTDSGIRPVDLDRIRTLQEEAEYIASLSGKASYTTPLFLSIAQCLNAVPSIVDEMQGIALMIDCVYNGDYLVGDYLEAHGLHYSRRNHALMLVSGFYPEKRRSNLAEPLREPIRRILVEHDTSLSANDLLNQFR